MKANWQVVPRGDVLPQYAGIYVTMNTKGIITMSRITYQKMGEPPAFIILFDTTNNRIGLKPSRQLTATAIPCSFQTKPVQNASVPGGLSRNTASICRTPSGSTTPTSMTKASSSSTSEPPNPAPEPPPATAGPRLRFVNGNIRFWTIFRRSIRYAE